MRVAARLFAQVRNSRFLEPGAPTGLTGLLTSSSPRPHLLYLYNTTLDKLKELPESSVYRQSTEALTRHRLELVEKTTPEGLEAHEAKQEKIFSENQEQLNKFAHGIRETSGGTWYETKIEGPEGATSSVQQEMQREGPDSFTGRNGDQAQLEKEIKEHMEGKRSKDNTLTLDPEPALTAEQIASLENQIGAGLIEEVIQVAEGELKLADTMAQNQVWEELAERPAEGQWSYFERGTHTST